MVAMTSTGNGPARSPTASNSSRRPMASQHPPTIWRTTGSRPAIALGLKTRLTRARKVSCIGGSIMMMLRSDAISSGSDDREFRSTPWLEENDCQSLWAATTSS